jgi:hypothetical protein
MIILKMIKSHSYLFKHESLLSTNEKVHKYFTTKRFIPDWLTVSMGTFICWTCKTLPILKPHIQQSVCLIENKYLLDAKITWNCTTCEHMYNTWNYYYRHIPIKVNQLHLIHCISCRSWFVASLVMESNFGFHSYK